MKLIRNNIEVIFFIVVVFALVSPYLFTRSFSGIDFSKTGGIGDTIGGLTSPFLNFLSIVLLYLTLREQIDANKQQGMANSVRSDYELTLQAYTQIKSEFDGICFKDLKSNSEYVGARAIFELSSILSTSKNISSQIGDAEIRSFCLSFTFMIHTIQSFLKRNFNSLIDKEDKLEFYSGIEKFKTPLLMLISAAGTYKKSLNGKETEIDKVVTMLTLLHAPITKEFNDHKPR